MNTIFATILSVLVAFVVPNWLTAQALSGRRTEACRMMNGRPCRIPPMMKPNRRPTVRKPHARPTRKPSVRRPTTAPATPNPTAPLPSSCPGLAATVLAHNGHLYARESIQSSTWNQADAAAKALRCCGRRGHLLVVNDASERDFIEIGLNDIEIEGTYVWTDGSPFNPNLFTVQAPDDEEQSDCGYYFENPDVLANWNVIPCTAPVSYMIIEFDCRSPPK